jgi:hypothetical protein
MTTLIGVSSESSIDIGSQNASLVHQPNLGGMTRPISGLAPMKLKAPPVSNTP